MLTMGEPLQMEWPTKQDAMITFEQELKPDRRERRRKKG